MRDGFNRFDGAFGTEFLLRLRSLRFFQCCTAKLIAIDELLKFQLCEQIIQLASFGRLNQILFRCKIDQRRIAADRRQIVGEIGHFLAVFQLFAQLRLDFGTVQMRINTVQRSKFMQQIARRFRPDPGNARNIVRAVAHERLKIDQAHRRKAVFLLKNLGRIIHGRGLPGLRTDELDHNVRLNELQAVAVAGQNHAVPAAFAALHADRADHIVRLPALTFVNRNVHCGQNLLHDRHLHGQLLGHAVARSLVTVVFQVAEGRAVQVEGNAQRVGLFLARDLLQDVQKAIDRVGIEALARRQRPHAVKRAVDDAVAVQNHQFHLKAPFRFACRPPPAACQ